MIAWFKRAANGVSTQQRRDMPEGLWVKCDGCGEILFRKDLAANSQVCFKCDHHFRMGCREYIRMMVDPDSFVAADEDLRSVDFLKFEDRKSYDARLTEVSAETRLTEAILTGSAVLDGVPIVIGAMDFSFIGGSMGSVVGERVKNAVARAHDRRCPLILAATSGGARMQEGLASLMQMAKTSARLAQFHQDGGLYICILRNPTTAGVLASFAMLGDVILAEPNALIGFAGPRVIKQTIGEDLPTGFQRAEFLLDHGFIDVIAHRKHMRDRVCGLVRFFHQPPRPAPAAARPPL